MTEVPMIDWYSSLLYSRERQRDLLLQAEERRRAQRRGERRRLEAARNTGQAGGIEGRFSVSRIRHRIGEALVSLGQMLL